MHQSSLVEKRVKEIKRRTRKKYNTEEKIKINKAKSLFIDNIKNKLSVRMK